MTIIVYRLLKSTAKTPYSDKKKSRFYIFLLLQHRCMRHYDVIEAVMLSTMDSYAIIQESVYQPRRRHIIACMPMTRGTKSRATPTFAAITMSFGVGQAYMPQYCEDFKCTLNHCLEWDK